MANNGFYPVRTKETVRTPFMRLAGTIQCTGEILLLVIVFLPWLLSCSNTRKLHPGSADSLPALPESVINIPVKIYAKPFSDKAETLTPRQFTSEQWPAYRQSGCDFRYKYRFVRSALKFSCINNQVTISLTGNYQVAGSKSACIAGKQVTPWINGSCGFNNEALRRVEISLTSALRFSPDYTLKSRSVVDKVNAVDKCSVTFLNTDITAMVMNTVHSSMDAFAATLDHDIAALNISSLVRKVETGIGQKIALHDYGYLSIHPSSVKIGKISYAADTLYLTAGFNCYPSLTSDGTGKSVKTSLPPLMNADLSGGFMVYANADYDYPFISRLLTKAARQHTFEIRGEKILIDSIEVRGLENNTIELKATFSGSRKGTLYLTGTPTLDLNSQVISVPNLAFSLDARSFVLNAGKTFFNKRILRAIRNQAVLHITTLYQQNKLQLDKALTHRFTGNIFSSGNTDQLSLIGLVIQKDRVLFQVYVKGKVAVTGN